MGVNIRYDPDVGCFTSDADENVAYMAWSVHKRDPSLGYAMAAGPDLLDSLDPDTLEAIANEIECFDHSARCGSLRWLAKRQRAAIAKATAP